MENQDHLIDEIINHLDSEIGLGAMRMSVGMDETQEENSKIDHKCCHMYGRPANEIVGLLDMYSDTGIEIGSVKKFVSLVKNGSFLVRI